MKHTETPWKIDHSHIADREGFTIWSGDMIVADVVDDQHGEADSNAAFIVEAVNNHDRLSSLESYFLEAQASYDKVKAENERLREALLGVLHQLSTDSDLDELVTAPQKYDALESEVRAALGCE